MHGRSTGRPGRQRMTKTLPGFPVKGLRKTSGRLKPAVRKQVKAIPVAQRPARIRERAERRELKQPTTIDVSRAIFEIFSGNYDYRSLNEEGKDAVRKRLAEKKFNAAPGVIKGLFYGSK